MADEPVVATNPQPVKAGNRPEDKTGGTLHQVAVKFLEAGVMKDGAWQETDIEARKYQQIATDILEGELKLVVNKEKTHLTSIYKGVAYLGFIIRPKALSIHPKKIKAFKDRIRQITPRNHGMNVEEMVKRLNPALRGWANYFRVANCKGLFAQLMEWIRRRLRMNSASPLINMALPNSWFAELELIDLVSYNVGILHYYYSN